MTDRFHDYSSSIDHRQLDYINPGLGVYQDTRMKVLNLSGRTISVCERSGIRYSIPDQRDAQMQQRVQVQSEYTLYKHETKTITNLDKAMGVYFTFEIYLSREAFRTFEAWARRQDNLDTHPLRKWWIWIPDQATEEIRKKTKELKGRNLSARLAFEASEQIGISIEYFIPVEVLDKHTNVYENNADILVSYLDVFSMPDHPYSKEGMEKTKEEEIKKRYENSEEPRMVFVDRTGRLGALYVKTATGCRILHSQKPSKEYPDPGIYLDHVYYDENDDFENIIKHVYITYSDNATLAKYGIYKSFAEATLEPKIEAESRDRKYKHEEHKQKEFGKILNYLSLIIVSVSPLIMKLITHLASKGTKETAKGIIAGLI